MDATFLYEGNRKALEYIYRNRSFYLMEDKISRNRNHPEFLISLKQQLTNQEDNQTKRNYIQQFYFKGLIDIFQSWKEEGFTSSKLEHYTRMMTYYSTSLLSGDNLPIHE